MQGVTHKTILRNLSDEERADLLERSDFAGLRHLIFHLGAIAVGTTLIWTEAGFLPLLFLVQGILIVFLFTALHETTHQTPFQSDFLNLWVGRLCGFLVFLGPTWFRYFHFAHHRHTNDPEKDPELASPRPSTLWQYVKYLSGLPELFDRFRLMIRNATKDNEDSFVSPRGRPKVKQEARIQLALYGLILLVSLAAQSPIVIYVWLLPFLLGGPFLRGYLLAEHAGCPHVPSMLDNTRTIFTNGLVRFLAWNMPYHIEHHAYPAVPFHKLPAFHRHTKDHLSNTENGYLVFNLKYINDFF